MANLPGISAFFPVYYDAPTIEELVNKAREALSELTDDWEIIIVDDCSPDGAGRIADRLAAENPRISVIHHERNRGYGGALKSGFAAASKEWVFYTDSDGQYDVAELKLLAEHMDKADVVNGYKISRADRLHRKILGTIYHHTAKILFRLKMRDVDCDFRLVRRDLIECLDLRSDSGVICVEMMAKVHGARARMVEVPVHHYPRLAGRSQFFRPGRVLSLIFGLLRQWILLVPLGGKRACRRKFEEAKAK